MIPLVSMASTADFIACPNSLECPGEMFSVASSSLK